MGNLNFEESFLIEEYKNLWGYYKKTLDERKNLFDWYLLIITLPSSIIGYFVVNTSSQFSIPDNIAAILLCIIFFIGLSLFISYSFECRNAEKYLLSIKRIKQHLCSEYNLHDIIHHNDGESPKMTNLFNTDLVRLFRSMIFILIDSSIISLSLVLFIDKGALFFLFVNMLFIALHILLFIKINK